MCHRGYRGTYCSGRVCTGEVRMTHAVMMGCMEGGLNEGWVGEQIDRLMDG